MAVIGSGISFDISWRPPITLMASQFDTMGTSVKSFKEPLTRSVKEVLIPSIKTNFASEGRPPWRPLSPLTIFKKGHDRILHETGKLARVGTQVNAWSIDGIGGEARLDGVQLPYAYYQQGGFWNVRTKTWVGPREWALIQEEDADRIEEIFWEWIEERWDRDVAAGRL